jgi:DNA-binding NtrC family response regulator
VDPEHEAESREGSFRDAIEPSLRARLHEPPVCVPPLARRAEDIRAIALDRLVSAGIADRGEPLGLADDALALLVEHPWLGDDEELEAVLVTAAARASARSSRRVEAIDVRPSLGT